MHWKSELIDRFAEILIFKAQKDRGKLVQVLRQVRGKNKTFPRHYWVKPDQVKESDVVVSNHELLPKKNKSSKQSKKSPVPSLEKPVPPKKTEKKNTLQEPIPPKKSEKKITNEKSYRKYKDAENDYFAELTRTRFELLNADSLNKIGFEISDDYSDLFEPNSMSDLLAVRDIKNNYLFFKYKDGESEKMRGFKVPSPLNFAKGLSKKDSKLFIDNYKNDLVLLGIDAKLFNDNITSLGIREADNSPEDLPLMELLSPELMEKFSPQSDEWMNRWGQIAETDIFEKAMEYNLDHNLSDAEVKTYKDKLQEYFSSGKKMNLINKNLSLFTSPSGNFTESDFHNINKSLKIDLFDRMGVLFGGSDSDVSPEELKQTLLEGSDEKFQKIKQVMREQRENNPIDRAIKSMNKINLKDIATGTIQSGNILADQLKKYSKAIYNRDRVFNSFKTIESANKAELWKALQKADKERKLLHNMTVHAFGEKAFKNGWDGHAVLELLGTTNGKNPDIESYLQIGNYISKNKTPFHSSAFGIEDKGQEQSKFFMDSKKDDSLDGVKRYIGIAKSIVEKEPSEGHTVRSLLKKYNKSLSDYSLKGIHFRDAFKRKNVKHELSDMKRAKVESLVSQFVLDSYIQGGRNV